MRVAKRNQFIVQSDREKRLTLREYRRMMRKNASDIDAQRQRLKKEVNYLLATPEKVEQYRVVTANERKQRRHETRMQLASMKPALQWMGIRLNSSELVDLLSDDAAPVTLRVKRTPDGRTRPMTFDSLADAIEKVMYSLSVQAPDRLSPVKHLTHVYAHCETVSRQVNNRTVRIGGEV